MSDEHICSQAQSFLKESVLPISKVFSCQNSFSRLRLIWNYKTHENLMAWNFGHTFLEVVFIQHYKAYLELVEEASVSMFTTEDIPDFCRFGAPFLRQGVYLKKLDEQQWRIHMENVNNEELEEGYNDSISLYQKKMVSKLIRAKLLTSMQLMHNERSKDILPTLFSLYDAVSALYITLDYQVSQIIRRQYQLLESYLFEREIS